MIRTLPIFKGWTVDARLKEFRKMDINVFPNFISFDSEKGDRILTQYIKTLDIKSPEFEEICAIL